MNAEQAVKIMAGKLDGDKAQAIEAIEEAMAVSDRTGLHGWLWSGSEMYTGDETVSSLEKEWESILAGEAE